MYECGIFTQKVQHYIIFIKVWHVGWRRKTIFVRENIIIIFPYCYFKLGSFRRVGPPQKCTIYVRIYIQLCPPTSAAGVVLPHPWPPTATTRTWFRSLTHTNWKRLFFKRLTPTSGSSLRNDNHNNTNNTSPSLVHLLWGKLIYSHTHPRKLL